jgi:hypothetical protein
MVSRAFPVSWKPKDLVSSETQVERDILQYLSLRGIFAWPTHGPRNKPAVPGTPDIIGALPDGRMLAIEVKAADGVVSEAQEQFHAGLFRCRVRVLVARSVDDVIVAGV